MLKSRLLKSILIPTLGISAIGSIAAVSTSCGKKDDPSSLQSIIITANEDSSFSLVNVGKNNPNLQYSTDGKNWNEYSESGEIPILSGTQLYLRGNNPTGWSKGSNNYSKLVFTGNVSISGHIMNLLDNGAKSGEQGDIIAIPCNFCFYKVFESSTGIKNIDASFLPSMNLTFGCYWSMFLGCTSLTAAPDLPAIALTSNCYQRMFQDCISLTTAPKLPAATLIDYCYYHMFQGCTSLTTVTDLIATDISFANGACKSMFQNCSSLTSIKISYTGVYDASRFDQWVNGVAQTGQFFYKGSQTAQDFGFPEGWTVQPY